MTITKLKEDLAKVVSKEYIDALKDIFSKAEDVLSKQPTLWGKDIIKTLGLSNVVFDDVEDKAVAIFQAELHNASNKLIRDIVDTVFKKGLQREEGIVNCVRSSVQYLDLLGHTTHIKVYSVDDFYDPGGTYINEMGEEEGETDEE